MSKQRYINETGQEQRIASIVEPVAEEMGLFLVRVKILPDNGCTLQIMAEDENGKFTIAQCQEFSNEISALLDAEEPIDGAYHLEVSSPGIDRPLVRERDFLRWQGHEARVELGQMLNGRKRFRGLIKHVKDGKVTITLPDVTEGAIADMDLPMADISFAKLILSDRLLEEARIEQENSPVVDDPEITTIDDIDLREQNLAEPKI
ncbi:MAG: ribosome maturation factor RimP [Devosiaceae bacterium]|nr:ribosome maturation factor RimP [Devosiaceae bacterium]